MGRLFRFPSDDFASDWCYRTITNRLLVDYVSIIGGLLLPEYSHIKDSVSDLLRTGAPNKALLDTLMIISNLLTIFGCYGVIVTHKKNMNRLVNAGVILMLATGMKAGSFLKYIQLLLFW